MSGTRAGLKGERRGEGGEERESWGARRPTTEPDGHTGGLDVAGGDHVASVDRRWTQLAHALSGLLCASFNFLDTTTTSSPQTAFAPATSHRTWQPAPRPQPDAAHPLGPPWFAGGVLRYGLLPRESVCTENVTPWLKLLPCHTHAGLAALLASKRLYDTSYLHLALHAVPTVRRAPYSKMQPAHTRSPHRLRPRHSPPPGPPWHALDAGPGHSPGHPSGPHGASAGYLDTLASPGLTAALAVPRGEPHRGDGAAATAYVSCPKPDRKARWLTGCPTTDAAASRVSRHWHRRCRSERRPRRGPVRPRSNHHPRQAYGAAPGCVRTAPHISDQNCVPFFPATSV